MRVSDLRIGVKLGAGFLAVVLFPTLLGVMALVQMSRIHQGADQIATNLLPSVAQTGELRVLLNRMRRSEAGLVTAQPQDDMQKAVDQVQARVRLNQAGTYQLPSTRVEAMYSPEMLGGCRIANSRLVDDVSEVGRAAVGDRSASGSRLRL